VHPPDVPVTVYVVVPLGFAVTDEPVVELNPVAGLQVYVFAPLTVRVADCPLQIEMFGDTVNVMLLTVIVTWAVAVQPLASVPVTVYVIVEDGLAETLAPVVLLRPVAGDHEYVLAPLAVNVVG
jgi:hypothetical protein